MDAPKQPTHPVKLWDLPTRIVHWALVVLVFLAWLSQELDQMDRHMTIGYAILALVLFRILWGLYGSVPSRFSDFVRGPGAILAYAKALLAGRPPKVAGHNPIGALSILALLGLLLLQASTGLFANDDLLTEGPLAKRVSKETSDDLTSVHKTNFDLLLIVIVLHVTAALVYTFVLKQPLIRAMITGRKNVPADVPQPVLRNVLWALPAAALAAGIVWYVVTRL